MSEEWKNRRDDEFEDPCPDVGSGKRPSIMSHLRSMAIAGVPLLIRGETGTGKSTLAEALHKSWFRENLSHNRFNPSGFSPINIGVIPADLIASQLFGHEKGSFTGATEQYVGAFERADGGTLFIDEVNRIPKPVQAKMLLALDPRHVRGDDSSKQGYKISSLGGRDITVRCWIVCASVKVDELEKELLNRIRGWEVTLKPLRHNRDTIPEKALKMLQRSLVAQYNWKMNLPALQGNRSNTRGAPESGSGETVKPKFPTPQFSDDGRRLLKEYDWPGNYRELESVMNVVALRFAQPIARCKIDSDMLRWAGVPVPSIVVSSTPSTTLRDEISRVAKRFGNWDEKHWRDQLRRSALDECRGEKDEFKLREKAAKMLDIHRKTLGDWIKTGSEEKATKDQDQVCTESPSATLPNP